MIRLNSRAQQRVIEALRHDLKKDPNSLLADLVFKKVITGDQARDIVLKRRHIFDMLTIQREAMGNKQEAMATRDPSFYGLAGKQFADAADHAIKAGFNSYAAIFLQEAINAKKLFRAPANEILALQKTLEGLKQ